MKITLVNILNPEVLFQLLDACAGPVFCNGMDLRHNKELKNLICGMEIPERGVPQLELTVCEASDVSRLLHYMRDGGRLAA